MQNQIEISYIFALDESGSMVGAKWDKLKMQVDKELRNIQNNHPNSKYSILKFNQTVTPFITEESIMNIDLKDLKIVGGGTNFSPVFRKINEISVGKKD